MKRLVSLLQKVKTFLFCSANLTDCSFAAESEEIVSSLQKMKKLFSFTAENEENCFFTAESEQIVSLLQKVKMFLFYSANLTDCFLYCRK